MAVTTALVAVAAGATVAGAMAQKSAAKKAGKAFEGVGQNTEKMNQLEDATRQLMGSDAENQRYEKLRTAATDIIDRQMRGELSVTTQKMLGRRAIESGAVGLGNNAVQDSFTAYLGMQTEQMQQQGFQNYRDYLAQITQTAQSQMDRSYAKQYNAAAANAGSIMGQGQAMAGMYQGIASIAGGLAGRGFGGAGGAAAGSKFSGGGSTGRAGI